MRPRSARPCDDWRWFGRVLRSCRHGRNHHHASVAVDAIESAVNTLAAHPLVGRRVEGDIRELVISFGATGYVALYRFIVQPDQVRVLALRHQREIGYMP
jgi:plasmid stabilization system protein ParE